MALKAQEFESGMVVTSETGIKAPLSNIGVRLTCFECPESVFSKATGLIIADERLGLTDPPTLQALIRLHILRVRKHGASSTIEATTHIFTF